jgi:hypothetical protein
MRRISIFTTAMLSLALASCSTANDFECPTTPPNGMTPPGESEFQNYYGNGALYTALWPEGVIEFDPSGPGEIRPDGSLAMKFPWWRGEGISGPIQVSGERLDQAGQGVTAEMPDGYGDTGFQASALVFPSEGCWEVTARVDDSQLTFIVEVVRIE